MANIELIERKKERQEFIGIEPAVGDTVGDVVGTAVGDAVGTVPMECAIGGREAQVRKEARSRKKGPKSKKEGKIVKTMGEWTQSP